MTLIITLKKFDIDYYFEIRDIWWMKPIVVSWSQIILLFYKRLIFFFYFFFNLFICFGVGSGNRIELNKKGFLNFAIQSINLQRKYYLDQKCITENKMEKFNCYDEEKKITADF